MLRNVNDYFNWKRNIYNRFEIIELVDYINEIKLENLNFKKFEIWDFDNHRTRALIRMRLNSNFIKFVKNKFLVKKIWNVFVVKFKVKSFEHINFDYEILNNCRLCFFLFRRRLCRQIRWINQSIEFFFSLMFSRFLNFNSFTNFTWISISSTKFIAKHTLKIIWVMTSICLLLLTISIILSNVSSTR